MEKIGEIEIDRAAYDEYERRSETLGRLENFGIWIPSLPEAAELIAIDMLYAGESDIENPEEWDGNTHDPASRLLFSCPQPERAQRTL